MLKLQFLDNRQPSMWLVDPRLSIGRDKSNSLVINDEGVSVFHAELRQEDGKLFLWDSGSVNGTFINGEQMTGKREVHAGDIIRFYQVEVQVIDPSKGPAVALSQAINREQEKPAHPQWQIKAMTGTTSGKMYLVDGTKVIGRDPGCDIIISGPHVSRRHAELSIRSGSLWMKDLGSSNGSFLNGKRSEESVLKNGDEVKFDAMTFRIVGPANAEESVDEADMTQFRPVVTPKPAAPAPKPVPAPAVAMTASALQPAPTAAVPAPALKVAPAPAAAPKVALKPVPAPLAATAKSSSGLGPLVLITLVVLGGIAAFFIMK